MHIYDVESFAISQKVRPNYRDREAPGKIGKHAIIVNTFIVIVVVFVIILFDDSVYIPILQRFFFFIEKVVEDYQSCFCTLTDVCTC